MIYQLNKLVKKRLKSPPLSEVEEGGFRGKKENYNINNNEPRSGSINETIWNSSGVRDSMDYIFLLLVKSLRDLFIAI